MDNEPRMDSLRRFRASLRALEREIDLQLRGETGCCGVTVGQCHVLLELDADGPLSLKDIGERLEMDKGSASRIVEGMVKAGMVVREQESADRRYVRVSLAPEGEERVRFINATCDDFYGRLLDAVSVEEREAVKTGVRILAERMRYARKSSVPDRRTCSTGTEAAADVGACVPDPSKGEANERSLGE